MLTTLDFRIHEVATYINWLYFFHAWGFPARLASIAKVHGCEACRQNWLTGFRPEERERAKEAMRLYDDAQRLLSEANGHIHTHARIGIFKANSIEDDVRIQTDEAQVDIPFLRQQAPGENGLCLCISDFVKPKEKGEDMIGVFACSVDKELEDGEKDEDYRHLLHQTLADRLAEATAEKAHELVRKEIWGFSPDEKLTMEEMFAEKYQGLRPAVGYPSIPDQSMTFLIDKVLRLNEIGVTLTESGAMLPHASTCGFILSHPATVHFGVGQIDEDQMRDYARRRGMNVEKMQKFINHLSK